MTAIVMARNSTATLARLFQHLSSENIPVLYIDHGSVDGSWQIARSFEGDPVKSMYWEPYLGHFDLTRQLQLKRDMIRLVESDWILHADADEFVETTSGEPLREMLGRYAGSNAMAFSCDEYAFLPASEEEQHDPSDFVETMRRYVHLRNRDEKQRLFRRDCPLDLWFDTGGHTVTLDRDRLAPERLRIRHYVGLSLDHLRSQYLARVFSGQDWVKSWHGARIGGSVDFVTAPDPALLYDIDADGWKAPRTLRSMPVFREPCLPETKRARLPDGTGLVVAQAENGGAACSEKVIAAAAQGLGVLHAGDNVVQLMAAGTLPLLHVLALPKIEAGAKQDVARAKAANWIRSVTRIRQAALIGHRRYAEIRLEECNDVTLATRLDALLTMAPAPVRTFPSHPPLDSAAPDPVLRRIGGPLLAELGYLPG